MPQIRNWKWMRDMSVRLLKERTGEDVAAWNRRIRAEGFKDKESLRKWLTRNGVTGYPQSHLVMEQFGFPDFLVASSDELIDGQYADRTHLRPILDVLINVAVDLGEVVIQARKTYVSLVTPKRTFARIQATTKTRIDVGLRLENQKPKGRLKPSKMHENLQIQISLTEPEDVDAELLDWLQAAYDENS